jgi:hypothetical protein
MTSIESAPIVKALAAAKTPAEVAAIVQREFSKKQNTNHSYMDNPAYKAVAMHGGDLGRNDGPVYHKKALGRDPCPLAFHRGITEGRSQGHAERAEHPCESV